MSHAVKKTISLPADLARDAEEVARIEGKSLSAVIQEALRDARSARLTREFNDLQGYWSGMARVRGILTESDLESFLKR